MAMLTRLHLPNTQTGAFKSSMSCNPTSCLEEKGSAVLYVHVCLLINRNIRQSSAFIFSTKTISFSCSAYSSRAISDGQKRMEFILGGPRGSDDQNHDDMLLLFTLYFKSERAAVQAVSACCARSVREILELCCTALRLPSFSPADQAVTGAIRVSFFLASLLFPSESQRYLQVA